MGLFSKGKVTAGEVGAFVSPHSPEDTLRLVYAGLSGQLSSDAFEVSAAGILESIYISRLDSTGITVTAGNSIETYWNFHVDLTTTANGSEGHAYFDRSSKSMSKWVGNAINIAAGVRMTLDGASVRLTQWTIQF